MKDKNYQHEKEIHSLELNLQKNESKFKAFKLLQEQKEKMN